MTSAHGSLEIRPAVRDDLPAVRALLASSLDCDPDAASLPDLLAVGPYADPGLRLVAMDGETVLGLGIASVRPTSTAPVGHLDLLAVSPERSGEGIGRGLLEAVEQRLRGRGVREIRVGGNAPCYAWPGVDVRYTGMVQLLESAGYARLEGGRGEAVNMSVLLSGAPAWLDTAADEARLASSGIEVRRLEPADPAFAEFMTGWAPRLAWEVERSAERPTSACHVALHAERYVAFACHHSNRAGWFGPMGTDPSMRRSGIGSVLLRRCLADMAAEGRDRADIAWVGPVGFYARGVGARISRVFWLYGRDL
jgi:predicted N-acetyltransferase YhbS